MLADRQLTEKQRKFIKNKTEGMTDRAAALKAGYSRNTAKNVKQHILGPTMFKALHEILEEKGLTDNQLAEDLLAGTKATKLVTSPTEPDREWPDWNNRHHFIETVLRIKHPEVGSNQTIVNYVQVVQTQLEKYAS